MLDLPSFTEVVKGFVELFQIGIKVCDEKGTKLAEIKVGNGDFCGYVFSLPDGRARCTATVARVKDGPLAPTLGARPLKEGGALPGVVAMPCFTGLRYLMMPISWEGDVLGRVVFGPFLPDELSSLPESLTGLDPGLDCEKAQQLLAKLRRAPELTVARVMKYFGQILDTMIAAGHKAFLTSQLHLQTSREYASELEEKNEKLVAMNARLKELDRLKSAFLATVSHELRTPLASIIGYSEMLAEGLAGSLNPEQGEYVRTIMEKGESLLKLISSILDISQIEAGRVSLSFEPTDALEVVRRSVSSVSPQARKKGVSLEVSLPGPAQPRVSADQERLRQVVVNLLANAVKFTQPGGKISVSLSEVGPQPELGKEGYRILVEDSGVGIPSGELEKIFQTFYQVDSSSTREYGGAGLGLAIVKSLVEGHGGVVRVTSELGKGSSFRIVLPAVSSAPRATVQVAPPAAPSIESL